MVIDNLNLKLVSNSTNLLRLVMYPSSQQRPLVEGCSTRQYRWRVRLQAWWKMIFYSIHVYLRLYGKVPPHQGLRCWSHYRWWVTLQDWMHGGRWFSIVFMFSPIYLRLEDVPPPPQDLDAGAITDGEWHCKIAWMEEMIFFYSIHV